MKLQGTMRINEAGHLEIGGCDTVQLVKEFGSPLYVMDEAQIRKTCKDYYDSFTSSYDNALVIYASKAFATMAMYKIVEQEGLGIDVVSGGELYTAIKAGFPMEKVFFHGNNKTPEELEMALEAGIGRFVLDNHFEMEVLNALAGQKGITAKVLLRVTPGIEAHTHEYIKTGQIDSKFGLVISNGQALQGIKAILGYDNLEFKGIHCHIGSQIFELESYRGAAEVMLDFVAQIKQELGADVEDLNLGGGFGIYYNKEDEPAQISDYAKLVCEAVLVKCEEHGLVKPRIIVEPGRSIVGPAGATLYTVGSVKHIPEVRTYVAVDGGMTDNPRPALYGSVYEAILANKATAQSEEVVSVAGKCCESGDMLIWNIQLPKVEPGDILAVSATGAYNYSMANNYNRIGRPAVVLVNEGQADVIVRRESHDDLVRNDVIPARIETKLGVRG